MYHLHIRDTSLPKWNKVIAIIGGVLLLVGTAYHAYQVHDRKSPGKKAGALEGKPLASRPVSEWPKITLAPRGKSHPIPQPPGTRVMIDGSNFRYHCAYHDGTERSFVRGEPPCPPGDMDVYVSNESGKSIEIRYAYEPF